LRAVFGLKRRRPELGQIDHGLFTAGHGLFDDEVLGISLPATIVGITVEVFTVTFQKFADEINDGIALFLIFKIERFELGVVFDLAFGNVIQLTFGVDGPHTDVAQNEFQHENRARHFFDRTHVELGRDLFVASHQKTNLRIVKTIVQRALGGLEDGAFGSLQISEQTITQGK